MGISGLLGLLKSIQRPCNIRDFKGQSIGVDAYGWLHRGAVACAIELTTGKPTTKFVDFSMHRVRMLIHFGIRPYLVFDGDRLPSKAGTEKGRRERRNESKANGIRLLEMGKTAQAYQELQKAIDVTPEMARQLIDALKQLRVDYVVAPYEADSQLAYLERNGIIDGILSEDSDLLVFGAKSLLTKLDQYGNLVWIQAKHFTACREANLTGWTPVEFRIMAILSGCDYLEGLPKMGLKTAHRLVRKYKTIDRIIRAIQLEGKIRVPPGYMEQFIQADMTFLYQWVYCPNSECLVNLTEPAEKEVLENLSYIGRYVEPDVAVGVARGDLDPMTKQKIIADPAWSQGYKPIRSRAQDSTKSIPSDKKIETFFKPKRVPLAELDPNSFTPSPSQRRLLEQHPSRPWITDSPSGQLMSVLPRPPMMPLQSSVTRPTVASAPRPVKRQRLCGDLGNSPLQGQDATGRQSRFFTSPAAEPSPSIRPLFRTKRTKKSEFNLWSDESIDDAMALLPAASLTVSTSKQSNLEIYSEEAKATQLSESTVAPHNAADEETTSPGSFTPLSLRDTRTIQTKFAFKDLPPIRTSADSFKQEKNRKLPRSLIPRPVKPSAPKTGSVPVTTRRKSPRSSAVHSQENSPIQQKILAVSPTRVYSRGSEDTLLVPESDFDSPASRDAGDSDWDNEITVVADSPVIDHTLGTPASDSADRKKLEVVDSEDDCDCDAEDLVGADAEARRRGLNLKRFTFAGTV